MKGLGILVLTACLLTGWVVSAQEGMSLSGTVEDQAGGVVPGAKLTLTNKATSETRAAVADDGGAFTFANLAPGKYSVKGAAKGFEPAELDITVGEQAPPPIKLELEISIKEEVTITDNQTEQTLSPAANADAVELSSDFLKTLPAQSEDILPILGNFLSPAAQGTEGLSVVVDGVEDSQLTVPTDAIRRVLINKNPYSVAFRRPGEGRVEVITKDGSRRRYDGTFAYYVRNSFFDSRDTFTRRAGLRNPKLDRRLFSASFGGPVPGWKKATFFVSGNHLSNTEVVVANPITITGTQVLHIPTFKGNTNFLGRFDYRPNQVHTLTARYYYYQLDEKNKGVGAGNPLALPEQGYSSRSNGQKFLLSDRAIFSPTILNDLQFSFDRRDEQLGQRTDKPMLLVRGYFISGPSQVARSGKTNSFEIQDSVTYTHGNHTMRFGGGLRQRFVNTVDASNFGGTYSFQGILDYQEKSPSQFNVTQGNPAVSYNLSETYGFFEDEIKLRRWFTLTPGIRYDLQSTVKDHNNFGPRLSFAFAPGKQKTVVRGGMGIFYERLPELATEHTLLLDGVHTKQLTITGPSYPDPFRLGSRKVARPSIWQLSPTLASPYLIIGSLSVERRIGNRTQVSAEYQRIHGVHLFRSRNINAPLDEFGPQFIGVRPNPNYLLIDQVESSASLRSSALKVTFQGRLGKWFRGMAQYTRSRTTDDTNGTFALPANNYDFRPELGRSNLDQRNRFNLVGTFDLPKSFRLGAILSIASGFPYDITTGFDDNGDRVANDRPLGGTRNTGLAPPTQQLDLRLTKLFKFPTPFSHKAGKSDRKLKNLEFSIDAFNVLNHPNTPLIVGALGSQIFGQANTVKMSRTLQFSVKYSF